MEKVMESYVNLKAEKVQTLWRTDINHSLINKKNMGQSIIYVMLPTAAALYCVI